MEFFKYTNKHSSYMTVKIKLAVDSFTGMAYKNYGYRAKDMLGKTLDIALREYDPNKGELRNYISRTITVIGKNMFKDEIPSDMSVYLTSNEQAYQEDTHKNEYNDEDEEITDEDKSAIECQEEVNRVLSNLETDSIEERNNSRVHKCIGELLMYFINNYEKFEDDYEGIGRSSGNLGEIYKKYGKEVVFDSLVDLKGCVNKAKRIRALSNKYMSRKYTGDRYLRSLNKQLNFLDCYNDTIVCKLKGSMYRHTYGYYINLHEILSELMDTYYSDDMKGVVDICGYKVYCSITGKIIIEDIAPILESEVVGKILSSKQNITVLKYEKTKYIIVVCPDEEFNIGIGVLGDTCYIPYKDLAIRIN